jgi:hypothetical protein
MYDLRLCLKYKVCFNIVNLKDYSEALEVKATVKTYSIYLLYRTYRKSRTSPLSYQSLIPEALIPKPLIPLSLISNPSNPRPLTQTSNQEQLHLIS